MRNKVVIGCALCEAPANMYCESDRASLCWRCDNNVHGANFLVAKHSRCVLCHNCQAMTPWTATGPRLPPSLSLCLSCVSSSHNNHNNPTTQLTLQSRVNDGHDEHDHDEDDDDNLYDSSLNEEDYDSKDESENEEEEDDDNENQVVPLTTTCNNAVQNMSMNSCSSDETEELEEEEEEEDDNSHMLSILSSPSLKRKRESFVSLNL